jgi:hypothetical protein
MAVTKAHEKRTDCPDEAEPYERSAVSLLVEKLRNRLDNWDTHRMAQVIHKGVQSYPIREEKTRKASK